MLGRGRRSFVHCIRSSTRRWHHSRRTLSLQNEVGMNAIVVETDKVDEVERGEPIENPMGWHSQMWLTDKDGNMYHEDELVMI